MGEDSYGSSESLSLEGSVVGDAGEHLVALAGTKTLELVTGTRVITVKFDAEITDLGVGQYVMVLAGGTVYAVTEDGGTRWSTSLGTASHVAAHKDAGVVGVLDGEELIGLDEQDGSRLFTKTRPHADIEPDGLYGGTCGIVLPAWSYLTAYGPEGTQLFDTNLPGTIETVGTLDNRVLVGLRNGNMIGLTPTGETAWKQALDAHEFAPAGVETLPAVTNRETVLVDTSGTVRRFELSDAPAERAYMSFDRTICCLVSEQEVHVYRQLDTEPTGLSATLLQEELERGDSLDIQISNDSETPTVTTLTIAATGGHVTGGERQFALEAGETRTITVTVSGHQGNDFGIKLTAGESTLIDTTVPLVGIPIGQMLDAEMDLIGVDDGAVTIGLTIKNESDTQITDVEIVPPGKSLSRLSPGEAVTIEHSTTFDPRQRVEATVTGSALGERLTTQASLTLPGTPLDLDLHRPSSDAPFVDVRLENQFSAPVRDTLRVELGTWEHERAIEMSPDSVFTLAVPLSDPTVTATVSGLDTTAADEFETAEVSQLPATWKGGRDEAMIDVARRVTNEFAGFTVREELAIRNTGRQPARDVRVNIAGAEWTTGSIPPDTEIHLDRWHQTTGPGSITIEGGEIHHEDGVATVDPIETAVETPELPIDATFTPGSSTHRLSVTVTNETQQELVVEKVVADLGGSDLHSWRGETLSGLDSLSPGERGGASWTVPTAECAVNGGAVRIGVGIQLPNSGERTFETVLARTGTQTTEVVAVTIDDGENITAGGYGHLSLGIENETDNEITNLRIASSGAALQTVYAPQEGETLEPNETLTHIVNLNPEGAGDVSIDVEIEGRNDGQQFTEQLTVSGPVSDADNWDPSLLEEWSVERQSAGSDDREQRLTTGYVREENRH